MSVCVCDLRKSEGTSTALMKREKRDTCWQTKSEMRAVVGLGETKVAASLATGRRVVCSGEVARAWGQQWG